jgi:hypothetical protein
MLVRAFRASPCSGKGLLHRYPSYRSACRTTRTAPPWSFRAFSTIPPRLQHDDKPPRVKQLTSVQTEEQQTESPESVKPESVENKAPAAAATLVKQDELLSATNMSTSAQRKADWAIMKEMSRYLWPKVEPKHWEEIQDLTLRRVTSPQKSAWVRR